MVIHFDWNLFYLHFLTTLSFKQCASKERHANSASPQKSNKFFSLVALSLESSPGGQKSPQSVSTGGTARASKMPVSCRQFFHFFPFFHFFFIFSFFHF